jgi:transposase-like protein
MMGQDKLSMIKNMFNLHLKECEFRFNNRKQNFA